MGFFDRFGAGGGKLDIKPNSLEVHAGQQLSGSVQFIGGSRAQDVTNIMLRLTVELTEQVKGPQGVQAQTHAKDVCPAVQVAQAFQVQPGQTRDFPFHFQLPSTVPASHKGHAVYKLLVAADIAGEIDPGDAQEITVLAGGAAAQQLGYGVPMAGAPMMMMPPPPLIGAKVYAQYHDGNWYPAQVVAIQNGVIGVDWIDAKLGSSTWVQPTQVRG